MAVLNMIRQRFGALYRFLVTAVNGAVDQLEMAQSCVQCSHKNCPAVIAVQLSGHNLPQRSLVIAEVIGERLAQSAPDIRLHQSFLAFLNRKIIRFRISDSLCRA